MKKRISAPKKAVGKSNQKSSGKKTPAVKKPAAKKSAAKPAVNAKARKSAAPAPSQAAAPSTGLGGWPPFRYPPA